MEIRLLGPGDEGTATDACRLFGEEGELDPSSFLSRPEAVLFVARDDGAPVGWVYGQELVHPTGELTMLLYALDVVEGSRRQGVGRALVEAFVDHARGRRCTEVWVLTETDNEAAIATYLSAQGAREADTSEMFVWSLADTAREPEAD